MRTAELVRLLIRLADVLDVRVWVGLCEPAPAGLVSDVVIREVRRRNDGKARKRCMVNNV